MDTDVTSATGRVEKGRGPYSVAANMSRTQSSELINTYYIYSYDGKLLEEYDHNGNCVKQYIYFGNRLLAEYQPQTNKYYYYMTDQINSTRIITDDNGDVVYSKAYGPYGGVQKTWTNTYDPKLKFSGKERETYSDLDYFGARYYDHNSYRFISVDPVINKDEALSNPQLWNLYSYCRNNPITYFDPDSRELRTTNIKTMQEIAGPAASMIRIVAGKLDVSGLSQSAMSNNEGATGKVDLGMPYVQKGGGAGAHNYAKQREKNLILQNPGFTQYPAGETLKKK